MTWLCTQFQALSSEVIAALIYCPSLSGHFFSNWSLTHSRVSVPPKCKLFLSCPTTFHMLLLISYDLFPFSLFLSYCAFIKRTDWVKRFLSIVPINLFRFNCSVHWLLNLLFYHLHARKFHLHFHCKWHFVSFTLLYIAGAIETFNYYFIYE